jgi:hypothetical protein
MTLNNTCGEDVSDVRCTIGLSGGLIILGKSTTRSTDVLPAGESMIIKAVIFGFGRTTITGNATCAQGATVSETVSGWVLAFFVVGLK